jgi:CBS domain-containing protein
MRRVADAMRTPVVAVKPATTVQETSARMLDADVHAAVVVQDGTVRALVTAARLGDALGEGYDPTETPVGEVAEPDPLLVEAGEMLAEAHERMRAADRAVVPVVASDGTPVGLLEDST